MLDERGGRFQIAPRGSYRSTRAYIAGTNVLQTRFETDTGSLLLTDLMPVASERDKRRALYPDHEIARIIDCDRGEVEVEALFEPRPDYGLRAPKYRDAGRLGLRVELGDGLLVLRTDLPLDEPRDGQVRGRLRLRAGQSAHFSLVHAHEGPAVLPPLGPWTREGVDRSVAWWRGWLSSLRYEGPVREAVIRSALVLKLLVHAPSGAVIAAPTTSLPERVGGDLNWDYRYCWLRDASLTVRALFGMGFTEEAEAFVSWLLHATRLTRPRLRVLYDVHGNNPAPERTLDHLRGHLGSRPVRVGNAAADQLQLDVHGEVVDAAAQFMRRGGDFDRETQRMLVEFGEYVCRSWGQPDDGIWEPRAARVHHTHSRVLCW